MLLVNAYTHKADAYKHCYHLERLKAMNRYDVAPATWRSCGLPKSFMGAQTEDWVSAQARHRRRELHGRAFRFSLDRTFNWTEI